ncbi:hypothetical protein N510_001933 [Firmicutes bacterium ASF500]|nr:hypothetical protein N510_001933 [Firmicutes bacterium ASF500]
MEKMIDIIPFLAGIVEKNTATHQSDFLLDRKILQGAAWEPHQESRTFLWMSRPCGTNCVLEAEAFQRETDAHITWTHYEYDADSIKAYRVIVAPEHAGGIVLGKVQPLHYKEQVQRVKQKALHVQSVKLQFEDGEETFLRWFASDTYRDTNRVLQYLYTIARNLCTDEYRRQRPVPFPEDIHQQEVDPLLSIALRTELDKLNAEDRELVLLRYVNEVPIGVLCNLYGQSRFSLHRRLSRILKVLKNALD